MEKKATFLATYAELKAWLQKPAEILTKGRQRCVFNLHDAHITYDYYGARKLMANTVPSAVLTWSVYCERINTWYVLQAAFRAWRLGYPGPHHFYAYYNSLHGIEPNYAIRPAKLDVTSWAEAPLWRRAYSRIMHQVYDRSGNLTVQIAIDILHAVRDHCQPGMKTYPLELPIKPFLPW